MQFRWKGRDNNNNNTNTNTDNNNLGGEEFSKPVAVADIKKSINNREEN